MILRLLNFVNKGNENVQGIHKIERFVNALNRAPSPGSCACEAVLASQAREGEKIDFGVAMTAMRSSLPQTPKKDKRLCENRVKMRNQGFRKVESPVSQRKNHPGKEQRMFSDGLHALLI